MLNFAWFFAKKIALSKSNKNLSKLIIRIGQIAVTLGIAVSVITVSIGLGSKKAIKQKMSDFNGHIVIRPYNTNNSFNSSPMALDSFSPPFLQDNPNIEDYQYFAELSGVIRTPKSFDGVIAKGVSPNYNTSHFQEFMVKGIMPKYENGRISEEVILSEKIAQRLALEIDSSFVMYFVREGKEPIYRRFRLKGIFSTEIKDIDNNYLLCDLQQIQKINGWNPKTVGGIELFIPDVEKVDEVYKGLHPENYYQYLFTKASDRFASISDWINLFDFNIVLIIVMMMVVVVINMMMVLVILIIERTQSIGVLKTLGANNAQIRAIFIEYALFIMIPGIVMGNLIALGFLIFQKYTQFIKLDPESYYVSSVPIYLSPWFVLAISLGALLVAAFILLIPSYVIAKIEPIKAIKFS